MLLRCPKCRKAFTWETGKGFPDDCQVCGEFIGTGRTDEEICLPAFISPRKNATDKIYRDFEKGSEVRAQLAAEAAGCDVSEMSALKITNMNDRRDAEIAHIDDGGALARIQASTPAPVGFQGTNASEYSGAVQSGPFPNQGAKTRTMIHQAHSALSNGSAVVDRPAIETQQVGYRRRG